jgi:hypothetical protein
VAQLFVIEEGGECDTTESGMAKMNRDRTEKVYSTKGIRESCLRTVKAARVTSSNYYSGHTSRLGNYKAFRERITFAPVLNFFFRDSTWPIYCLQPFKVLEF